MGWTKRRVIAAICVVVSGILLLSGGILLGSRVHFLDIGNQFLDGDGNIPSEIMPDKVHLSAQGYDLWYKAMELVLPELMR
jgi:hypothetical protein